MFLRRGCTNAKIANAKLGGIKWHLWNLTHKPALYLVYLRLQVRYPFLKLLKCGVKCVYGSRNVACKALITLLEFRNFFFYRFFFHIDPRGVFMPPNGKSSPTPPTKPLD